MNCVPLATTGLDTPLGVLILVAILGVVFGVAVFLASWRGPAGRSLAMAALLLVSVGGVGLVLAAPAPAAAADRECTSERNSLTVTQTSSLRDLAPGIAPTSITGLVVNNGPDETHVTAVAVEILSVSSGAGRQSIAGCDASDFLVVDAVMNVGRTLAPGGSAPFSGASIGFADKPINQDACRLATVHLRYTANP